MIFVLLTDSLPYHINALHSKHSQSLCLAAIKELFNYFLIAGKLNEVCTAQDIWLSYYKTQGGS